MVRCVSRFKLSRHALFLSVAFGLHCYNNFAYRFIDSYLPNYANSEGVNDLQIGIIFAAFSFAIFLSSPVWGVLCNRVGYKSIIVVGLVIESCVLLCYPLLRTVSGTAFMVAVTSMRVIQGVGSAATQTGCYALIAAETSGDSGTGSGNDEGSAGEGVGGMEMFGGIGNSLGPIVSGALFAQWGFSVPPFLIGVIGILALYLIGFVLPTKQQLVDEVDTAFILENTHGLVPSESQSSLPAQSLRSSRSMSSLSLSVRAYIGNSHSNGRHEAPVSVLQVLLIPSVLYCSLVAVIALASLSFLDATLQPAFYEQHQLTQFEVGLCFGLSSLAQLLTCPLAGYISDNYATKAPIVMGLSFMAVALLLLGPSPLLTIMPVSLDSQLPALALLGCGASWAVIPTFVDAIQSSKHLGPASQAVVAGLSAAMFSLGEVFGPLLGSTMVQLFSFAWCCTIFAGATAAMVGIGLLLIAMRIVPYDPKRYEIIPEPTPPPPSTIEVVSARAVQAATDSGDNDTMFEALP